jgi:hypothetical protein
LKTALRLHASSFDLAQDALGSSALREIVEKIRKFVLYFTFLDKVVKHGHHPLL